MLKIIIVRHVIIAHFKIELPSTLDPNNSSVVLNNDLTNLSSFMRNRNSEVSFIDIHLQSKIFLKNKQILNLIP